MFRRFFIPAAIFLVVASLSFVTTRRVRSQPEPHKGFTAFQIERRYDDTGTERYQEYRLYAVKSDGSSVKTNSRVGPDGRVYRVSDIYDIPNAKVVAVDGFTDSVVTQKFTEGELAYHKGVDHSCSSAPEHSSILGLDVVKVSEVQGATERSSESTEWKAPALGCFPVTSTHVLSVPPGKPVAKTTIETLFVIMGEPQASLFELPTDYAERSPSQVSEEFARRFGRVPFSTTVLDRAEKKYQERHK